MICGNNTHRPNNQPINKLVFSNVDYSFQSGTFINLVFPILRLTMIYGLSFSRILTPKLLNNKDVLAIYTTTRKNEVDFTLKFCNYYEGSNYTTDGANVTSLGFC